MTLRRRPLLAACAAAALAAPGIVRSQSTGKVWRIGVLAQSNSRQSFGGLQTVMNDLAALGYLEDRHYTIDYKFAQNDGDRLPALAAELVASRADLIVTLLNPETLAAKGATRTILIVMMFGLVPVEVGLVASLARPGGNVTGTITTSPDLAGKQLEFFSKVLPRAARISFVLSDPDSPGAEMFDRARESAAVAMGLRVMNYPVRTAEDLKRALDAMERELPDGLWVRATGVAMSNPGPVIWAGRDLYTRSSSANARARCTTAGR